MKGEMERVLVPGEEREKGETRWGGRGVRRDAGGIYRLSLLSRLSADSLHVVFRGI